MVGLLRDARIWVPRAGRGLELRDTKVPAPRGSRRHAGESGGRRDAKGWAEWRRSTRNSGMQNGRARLMRGQKLLPQESSTFDFQGWVQGNPLCEREGNNLKGFKNFHPKNGSSQGQIPDMTVFSCDRFYYSPGSQRFPRSDCVEVGTSFTGPAMSTEPAALCSSSDPSSAYAPRKPRVPTTSKMTHREWLECHAGTIF